MIGNGQKSNSKPFFYHHGDRWPKLFKHTALLEQQQQAQNGCGEPLRCQDLPDNFTWIYKAGTHVVKENNVPILVGTHYVSNTLSFSFT